MPRLVALLVLLALPAAAPAQTYWLGRKPDPKTEEYVFDIPVPPDLAVALVGAGKYARFRDGVREFQFEADGKTHTFLESPIAWDGDKIDRGRFAFLRNNAVDAKDWTGVATNSAEWRACREAFLDQRKPLFDGKWSQVTPIVLKHTGSGNPKLRVDFDADGPFDVARHPGRYDSTVGVVAPTKGSQIVPVVHGKELFVAWHTWGRTEPTDKVVVAKIPLADLAKRKLTAVRQVPSGGRLVGFAVDDAGADYVLTAKVETFPNRPVGDFVEAVHKMWRTDVLTLHAKGAAKDLSGEKYADIPVYGVGTGRLAAGGGALGAVFARRRYTAGDNFIHQEADALVVSPDADRVGLKARNRASHSFDQRLVFDGTDFVALHQGDVWPAAALLIEKFPNSGRRPAAVAAFVCPILHNDVYYELGGLAAEKDGYPVLFTATRNTETVGPKAAAAKRAVPWDLAMVYVARDFDTKPKPQNLYDVVGSGVLAGGYGKAEEFTAEDFAWNWAKSDWEPGRERKFTRRVEWLTDYDADKKVTRKATAAKMVQLAEGKYLAVWEQHALAGGKWQYDQTWAMTVTAEGPIGNKQIKKGKPVAFKNLRLHRGDDAVALPIGNATVAGWVTAGATNKQLLLHTLDADLKYKAYPLQVP